MKPSLDPEANKSGIFRAATEAIHSPFLFDSSGWVLSTKPLCALCAMALGFFWVVNQTAIDLNRFLCFSTKQTWEILSIDNTPILWPSNEGVIGKERYGVDGSLMCSSNNIQRLTTHFGLFCSKHYPLNTRCVSSTIFQNLAVRSRPPEMVASRE